MRHFPVGVPARSRSQGSEKRWPARLATGVAWPVAKVYIPSEPARVCEHAAPWRSRGPGRPWTAPPHCRWSPMGPCHCGPSPGAGGPPATQAVASAKEFFFSSLPDRRPKTGHFSWRGPPTVKAPRTCSARAPGQTVAHVGATWPWHGRLRPFPGPAARPPGACRGPGAGPGAVRSWAAEPRAGVAGGHPILSPPGHPVRQPLVSPRLPGCDHVEGQPGGPESTFAQVVFWGAKRSGSPMKGRPAFQHLGPSGGRWLRLCAARRERGRGGDEKTKSATRQMTPRSGARERSRSLIRGERGDPMVNRSGPDG
jgi:hypothetical protein